MPTPRTLLVDVTGHPQPLAALEDLAQVVEPDVRVLVVGDRTDVGFYRQLTRGLGVADYLYKPLTAGMVARHFGPIVGGRGAPGPATRRPGAERSPGCAAASAPRPSPPTSPGTSATCADRHTVVLDADLHRGTRPCCWARSRAPGCATRSSTRTGSTSCSSSAPQPVVTERLHVLAAEEALRRRPSPMRRRRRSSCLGHAPPALQFHRRRRAASRPAPLGRALLDLAQQRVLVLEPTLACMRDTLRLLQLPSGPRQTAGPCWC